MVFFSTTLLRNRAAESGGPPSGCGFLSQALQRQPHRVIKVGGGEVGSELQLGNEAPEEYAALLYRQAVGGRPDRSKLRIRQSQHAAIVLRSNVNFLTDQGGGKRCDIVYSRIRSTVQIALS